MRVFEAVQDAASGAWEVVKENGRGIVAGTATGVSLVAQQAMATLPTGVDTAFTGFQTDATTLAGYAAPVLLAILGFTIAFKLIKRFANKI